MAANKNDANSAIAKNLRTLTDALLVEMPIAGARALLTREGERRVCECSWKAYEAWIGLVNEASSRFYKSRTVGALAGRMLERTVRFTQVGDALVGAAFALLWPAVGLPTAAQVLRLEDQVAALREELRLKMVEQADRDEAEQAPTENGAAGKMACDESAGKAPGRNPVGEMPAARWSGALALLLPAAEVTGDVNI